MAPRMLLLAALAWGVAGCGANVNVVGDGNGGSGGWGGSTGIDDPGDPGCVTPCPGGACDAQGACKLKAGDPCSQSNECASGQCVEGTCGCIAQISANYSGTCVRKMDGSAWCWGINEYGDVGDGTTEPRFAPVPVASLGPIVSIAGGHGGHTCAIRADGGVSCWGLNTHGKLGNGSLIDGNQPLPGGVASFGAPPVRELALGGHHTCARDSTDQLWCWGNNAGGLLGNGEYPPETDSEPAPIESTVVGPMVQISAGPNHNCGRAADGTVWCWGLNEEVPIGDGSTDEAHPDPVQVTGLDQVVELAVDTWRSCAVKADGTAWCWGSSWIGDGTMYEDALVPAQVVGLDSVVEIDIGLHFSCARRTNGTVWCWGMNAYGVLGDASPDMVAASPVELTGFPAPVVEMTAGPYHACARLIDDSVWCWGGFPKQSNPSIFDLEATPVPVKVPLSCP